MSHFYERVLKTPVDFVKETNKLVCIFEYKEVSTSAFYDDVSVRTFIDKEIFRKMDLSGDNISFYYSK